MSARRWRLRAAGLLVVALAAPVAAAVPAAAAVRPPAGAAAATFTTTVGGVRCTGPATKAARATALRVQRALGPALRATRARTSVAVDDTATGVTCTASDGRTYDSASVVKVAIVAALLQARRAAGRPVSATERAEARRAITRSDNAAASALWRRVGGAAGMRRFFALAGMAHTVPGSSAWGLTQVTAGDQLVLLRLVTGPGLLDPADRRTLRDLMAAVVKSQRWGVPVGAPASATVGVKNGWLHRRTHAWRVHSIGWVEQRTTTYRVVLLGDGWPSLTVGVRGLARLARAVHTALAR
ncbi:MAG TPA: serine hydrolase [Kineosporiaceae bacterium]|nr:serine hydrolase [Kineosporiaceae bacterium]